MTVPSPDTAEPPTPTFRPLGVSDSRVGVERVVRRLVGDDLVRLRVRGPQHRGDVGGRSSLRISRSVQDLHCIEWGRHIEQVIGDGAHTENGSGRKPLEGGRARVVEEGIVDRLRGHRRCAVGEDGGGEAEDQERTSFTEHGVTCLLS